MIGKFLITTDEWFVAPDGDQYKAVFGTVIGVVSSEVVLGLKTNRGSTNWYVEIGNMLIAGCQIHYAIKTDKVNFAPAVRPIEYEGKLNLPREDKTKIYNADKGTR